VQSRPLPLVGLLFAVVAAVGYVAFDWRFGGDSSPVVLALAAVAVALAVGSELRSRR
jgi:ABC-type Fe3+-siderophore transport system permease subunit